MAKTNFFSTEPGMWSGVVVALLGVIAILNLATGCATTNTHWHPQSEYEMRQVIGETMLMAMNQYDQYLQMLEEQAKKGPLKGLKDAPYEQY